MSRMTKVTMFSFSFAQLCVLRSLLNTLPLALPGRAAHFLLMREEYLKGKGKRIARPITQLSHSYHGGARRMWALDVKASAEGTCSLSTIVSLHAFCGGTGTSNLTANPASSLVQWGKRITMVATGIQSPGIHVLFGLDRQNVRRTLNDYLCGRWSSEQVAHDATGILNQRTAGGSALCLLPSSINARDIAKASVLATSGIRRPELAWENTSCCLLLLADSQEEEYNRKHVSAQVYKGGMDIVQRILTFIARLTRFCLQSLHHRYVTWTTPGSTQWLQVWAMAHVSFDKGGSRDIFRFLARLLNGD